LKYECILPILLRVRDIYIILYVCIRMGIPICSKINIITNTTAIELFYCVQPKNIHSKNQKQLTTIILLFKALRYALLRPVFYNVYIGTCVYQTKRVREDVCK